MKEEVELALKKLSDAVLRLEEGVDQCVDELDKDGVIQRFEFTFELLWKALKIILEDKGHIYRSPKDCFKGAFKIGLIEDEAGTMQLMDDRNKMSHIYSKKESEKIFQAIQGHHLGLIKTVLARLNKEAV